MDPRITPDGRPTRAQAMRVWDEPKAVALLLILALLFLVVIRRGFSGLVVKL